jgi:hydrogenase nickel incorporation protein HypA/HybF
MHELSIVTYVIDQVKEIAEQNDLKDVESVTLEFGGVSGIVPEYLVDCWAW